MCSNSSQDQMAGGRNLCGTDNEQLLTLHVPARIIGWKSLLSEKRREKKVVRRHVLLCVCVCVSVCECVIYTRLCILGGLSIHLSPSHSLVQSLLPWQRRRRGNAVGVPKIVFSLPHPTPHRRAHICAHTDTHTHTHAAPSSILHIYKLAGCSDRVCVWVCVGVCLPVCVQYSLFMLAGKSIQTHEQREMGWGKAGQAECCSTEDEVMQEQQYSLFMPLWRDNCFHSFIISRVSSACQLLVQQVVVALWGAIKQG